MEYFIGFTHLILRLMQVCKIALVLNYMYEPKIQDEFAMLSTGLDLTVDYGWLRFIALIFVSVT
ncbi:MAG: YidC/Oxa1 family insertase periplasmic-domain containing protein [Moraxellaceae bacterium]|nr:YidC/Oxa1 family insertase periplasmic-domain containing protein [Moraxellaceae bacterium]